MLTLILSFMAMSSPVNAGVCRQMIGYVVEFDQSSLTFQEVGKKKRTQIQLEHLHPEQQKFLKGNVNSLVGECVPFKSIGKKKKA